MNLNNGKIWPLAIGISIVAVFMMSIGTILITNKANIQLSDNYMTSYQNADENANKYIESQIAFDKKYTISYINNSISENGTNIKYKVTDKENKPIDLMKVKISVSRAETAEYTQKYTDPTVSNGIYVFENIKFPKAGLWNIIAKFEIDNESRFLNIKVDTRSDKIKYFE
jgi:nitrogen fixation protein FixH